MDSSLEFSIGSITNPSAAAIVTFDVKIIAPDGTLIDSNNAQDFRIVLEAN